MLWTGHQEEVFRSFTIGNWGWVTDPPLVHQFCHLMKLQTIHVDMNWAFWNVICKWLRACSACMLFINTWGRWSEISTCPSLLPKHYCVLVAKFCFDSNSLLVGSSQRDQATRSRMKLMTTYKEANEEGPHAPFICFTFFMQSFIWLFNMALITLFNYANYMLMFHFTFLI